MPSGRKSLVTWPPTRGLQHSLLPPPPHPVAPHPPPPPPPHPVAPYPILCRGSSSGNVVIWGGGGGGGGSYWVWRGELVSLLSWEELWDIELFQVSHILLTGISSYSGKLSGQLWPRDVVWLFSLNISDRVSYTRLCMGYVYLGRSSIQGMRLTTCAPVGRWSFLSFLLSCVGCSELKTTTAQGFWMW